MRRTHALLLPLIALLTLNIAAAQTTNGTISGIVLDPSGMAIPGAEILIVNDATGVRYPSATNSEGIYAVSNLPPGSYRIQISKYGFKALIKPDLVLQTQGALAINFTLPVGADSETVTVTGGSPLINTQSGSVSTVIDREFVGSLPLNGRSFNTLLQLTPGVVIAAIPNSDSAGQFSVAGQRTDANSFTVDGISANFGTLPGFPPGSTGLGQAPAFSAIGGTSSLVSVEALQEFRVETSSFSPEFGRTPGGQVALSTRSGTNDLHGGAYDYFRNDVLDANDWFANAAGNRRAPERHNDFGSYLGGAVRRNRTFFFLSYEGARLRLPQTTVIQVPSAGARASASNPVAPYLDSFPRPGPNATLSPDGETASFTGTYSNAATLNAGSLRVDHTFSNHLSIFGRYNEAPSSTLSRVGSLNNLNATSVDTRTLTVGLNAVHGRMTHALRANYSQQNAGTAFSIDNFGGASPISPQLLLGNLEPDENYGVFLTFDTESFGVGPYSTNRTRQLNAVENIELTAGAHQLGFGADYRAIFFHTQAYQAYAQLVASSVGEFAATGQAGLYTGTVAPSDLLAQALSLYAQDTWRTTPRLNLNYGIRWELSPAPSGRGSTRLAAWRNVDTPALISLAPEGTALWGTTYGNFAPRLGIAYRLTADGNLVFRLGGGFFYDLGIGNVARLAKSFPNIATAVTSSVAVPVADLTPYLPPPVSFSPPYSGTIYAFAPGLQLPWSAQWNLSLEKSFGVKRAVSLTYLGQRGGRGLRLEASYRPNPDFNGEFLLTGNDSWSNYEALQIQYRRPLTQGLQALLSYSFSHSLDNASNDVVAGFSPTVISGAADYANSDFDVRHSFSGALTYELPRRPKGGILRSLTSNWDLASVMVARTGFPFNAVVIGTSPDPSGYVLTRPDLVPGQSFWTAVRGAPGGKILNSAAFSVPSSPRQGTEGRNDIPGFALTQVDLSIERTFPIRDRLRLRFRTDAFNVLNHPNFTNPGGAFQFGPSGLQSQSMLNQGLGGLNPLFQEGGPRSLQLSLKLDF